MPCLDPALFGLPHLDPTLTGSYKPICLDFGPHKLQSFFLTYTAFLLTAHVQLLLYRLPCNNSLFW